ncbi:hypothetical protein [uncultured Helicobacter sp.]|uniref:hypothetical protein n=1 Tax=uncultured Helicobacter sp. TaxID=175537 RepID=UPI003753807E
MDLVSRFRVLVLDSESKTITESKFTDSKSKQLTQSPTSKNLIKALPNINNSACGSTSLAQLQKWQNLKL